MKINEVKKADSYVTAFRTANGLLDDLEGYGPGDVVINFRVKRTSTDYTFVIENEHAVEIASDFLHKSAKALTELGVDFSEEER